MEGCLIGRVVTIGDCRFAVQQEYWRTKSSFGQKLIAWKDLEEYEGRISHQSRFAVARHNGSCYWIKELLGPPRRGGAAYEAQQMTRLAGVIGEPQAKIGPVKLYAYDNSRLAMEYLDQYVPVLALPNAAQVGCVTQVLAWWLGRCRVQSYDLSPNNVMVRWRPRALTVKLVDFAWSPCREPGYWDKTMARWIQDVRARNRRRALREKRDG